VPGNHDEILKSAGSRWFAPALSTMPDWTGGNPTAVNELVTPRTKAAEDAHAAGRSVRVLAIEALGPLTALGGIVWAIAQPYRVTFFYPEGKGVWEWLVQPPLLVVIVGLLFSLVVAPGLVDDLEQREHGDATG
jgi:hypothetical protein